MSKQIFFSIFVGVVLAMAGTTVEAQGSELCSGRVSGTVNHVNPNAGITYFDAHPGPAVLADLTLFGKNEFGLAPGDINYAACTDYDSGSVNLFEFNNKEYFQKLAGWAYNDNLGFVSFSCEDGLNLSSENIDPADVNAACGGIDYGVYFELPVAGVSEVFGYAWSPIAGWIQFSGDCEYGSVTADINGNLSGFACTEMGVPIDFDGVNVEYVSPFSGPEGAWWNEDGTEVFVNELFDRVLLDEMNNDNGVRRFIEGDDGVANAGGNRAAARTALDSNWCDGRKGLCVEVYPNPNALQVELSAGERAFKLANGEDAYEIRLYLQDENGAVLNPDDFDNWEVFTDSIVLKWKDTVKRDQIDGVVNNRLNEVARPFAEADGAVIFKPIGFDDFVWNNAGYYAAEVQSLAPTTEGNVSMTHTEPPYAFSNELFLNNEDEAYAAEVVEENRLRLNSIQFEPLMKNGSVFSRGPVYPNGQMGVNLLFRPAISVSDLYADAFRDAISAIRGLPVFLTAKYFVDDSLPADFINSASVSFEADFGSANGGFVHPRCRDGQMFTFNFVESLLGRNIEDSSSLVAEVSSLPANQTSQFMAQSNILNEEACAGVRSPVVYSKISYQVNGERIEYYSNKLPKTDAALKNPAIVVHGNIQAQSVASVSAQNQVQSAGSVNVSMVKNIVRKNIDRFLPVDNFENEQYQKQKCTINSLSEQAIAQCGRFAIYKKIGNEDVIYVFGKNVEIDLPEGYDFSDQQWTIISDAGNIFINSDLVDDDVFTVGAFADDKSYLNIIALRDPAKFNQTGHIYIAGRSEESEPVKNIRATLIADGSVFSYVPGQNFSGNGEPIWDGIEARTEALNDQLLIEGSVYSDNTVGGADIDNLQGKNYLLLGGGNVIKAPYDLDDRLTAQLYDLNYLRLFQLELEMCENGLPKDQQCGKCLTIEDMKKIVAEDEEPVLGPNGEQCDGIDPTSKYDGQNNGDLIIPQDPGRLARGLDNGLSVNFGGRPEENADAAWWERENEYEPVFIFYRAPAEGAFVFEN